MYTPVGKVLFPKAISLVGPLLRPALGREGHALRNNASGAREKNKPIRDSDSPNAVYFRILLDHLKALSQKTMEPQEMVKEIQGMVVFPERIFDPKLKVPTVRLLWNSLPKTWIMEERIREVLLDAEMVAYGVGSIPSNQDLISLTSAKATALAKAGLTMEALRGKWVEGLGKGNMMDGRYSPPLIHSSSCSQGSP